jgi:hypothetical protein
VYGFSHSANSTPQRRRSNDGFPFFRIAAMERAIVIRYGEARLPDDDAGRDILRPMADHLAQVDPRRIRRWAAAWMPTLSAADVDEMIASREALIAECGKTALHWNADALAHEIDLDDATRTRAKAWTIGAVDCDKAAREERRKITRAATARARRAAAGATPRAQSITATEPWIKDGFKTRRTWERHGKRPRVANASPATSSSQSLPVTRLRHEERRPIHKPNVETEAPASPRSPARCQASSIDPQEREAVVSETTAGPEHERLQLQERARLHLNDVVANMMQSDDPALWQPLFRAATSEWSGHRLLDADERVLAGPRPGACAPW